MPDAVPRGISISSGPSSVSNTIVAPSVACVYGRVSTVAQVGALALEAGVGLHPEVHVQVAGGATPRPDGAPPGQPQRRAVVDAGDDVDRVGALLDPAALTPAHRRTGWR